MQPKWELTLGAVRGFNLPERIISEEHRLRRALSEGCNGPYNEARTNLRLAILVEGDNLPLDRHGIQIEPFKNNAIGAQIFIRKTDWSTEALAYRRLLWQNVEKAVWACVETLAQKQVSLDVVKLRGDLFLVEREFMGSDLESKPAPNSFASAANGATAPYADVLDGGMDQIVIQYRIAGHGNRNDQDKRAAVENLLDDCLSKDGLGSCDGGDIGSGTMNIFCFVSDTEKARDLIIRTLRIGGLLEGAVIQETVNGEEKVVWPPDYAGDFSVV